jgi:chondroitin AC lyase
LSNQPEKGSWADITDQKNISEEIISMDVFKLWFNHGNSPDSAFYEYIVVPAVSQLELQQTSASNRDIDILANSPHVQAVRNNKLAICQVAFYRAGEIEVSKGVKLRMDSQGMAMVKMRGDQIEELTVSDPSRKLNRILVTVSGKYEAKGSHFTTYSNGDIDQTLIIVDLPQGVYAGKSVGLTFN